MKALFDRTEIEKVLPHRPPFLFVDEVLEMVPGERIVGRFQVGESFCMKGSAGTPSPHFPATLLTESMAQVGAFLVMRPPENRGRDILFRSIERFRLRHPIPLGAVVRIEGVVHRMRGRLGSLKMKAFSNDRLAAEAHMAFALSD